jgi:hypothetical protein
MELDGFAQGIHKTHRPGSFSDIQRLIGVTSQIAAIQEKAVSRQGRRISLAI